MHLVPARPRYWVHSDPHASETQASNTACPGRHNDAAREAGKLPAAGEPVWCRVCTDAVRSALRYLPLAAKALEAELLEATDVAPERVSGTRSRPLHEHQAQAILIDEIRDTLAQLEDLVREWRHLSARKRKGVTTHTSIARSSAFLTAHLQWITTSAPDADDPDEYALVRWFIERIRSLDVRAMHLTHQDEAKPEECIGVPCNRCDMRSTLVHALDRSGAGKGAVECRNCGRKYTLEEYRDLATQWGIYEYGHLDDEQREHFAPAVAAYERARAAARPAPKAAA